ncbi:MAG: hypothetical protein AAF517_08680 [Planctomycetota bacterium]
MKRRAVITVTVLFFVVIAGGGVGLLVYGDRIVEEWQLRKLASDQPEERDRAAEELVGMGSTRAVPRFIEMLRDGYTPGESHAKAIVESIPTVKLDQLGSELCQEEAAVFLRILLLADLKKNAVFLLRRGLLHPEEGLRRYAAEALSKLGKGAELARPQLEKALQDSSEDVKLWADIALSQIPES